MVLHHVAQHAGAIKVAGSRADAGVLRYGDLHLIHVVAIPQRLDDAVSKAQDQEVLHSLFAEIVIDAIDLIFVEMTMQLLVECSGAG